MRAPAPDRRLSVRYDFKVPIRIRVWKSSSAEQSRKSENVSDRGIYFTTDSRMPIGAVVDILLRMPEHITRSATVEWLCTGHVVRVEPFDLSQGKFGIGVQFVCYEQSRVDRV